MKKLKYSKPSFELIKLLNNDVILASAPPPGGDVDPFGFGTPLTTSFQKIDETENGLFGFKETESEINDGFIEPEDHDVDQLLDELGKNGDSGIDDSFGFNQIEPEEISIDDNVNIENIDEGSIGE